jgi:hypothetical protein
MSARKRADVRKRPEGHRDSQLGHTPVAELIRRFIEDVEASAAWVEVCDRAYNAVGQPHFVVHNGFLKGEHEPAAPLLDLPSMLALSREAIASQKRAMTGDEPAVLYWRIYPEFYKGDSLYMRLSWAPV